MVAKSKTHNEDGSPILPSVSPSVVGGYCGKCGAPYFIYSGPWMGVNPPPPQPSCHCWNNRVKTTTNTGGVD